jgi:hypothetical protein
MVCYILNHNLVYVKGFTSYCLYHFYGSFSFAGSFRSGKFTWTEPPEVEEWGNAVYGGGSGGVEKSRERVLEGFLGQGQMQGLNQYTDDGISALDAGIPDFPPVIE